MVSPFLLAFERYRGLFFNKMLIYFFANFRVREKIFISNLSSITQSWRACLFVLPYGGYYFIVLEVVSFNIEFVYKIVVTKKIIFLV